MAAGRLWPSALPYPERPDLWPGRTPLLSAGMLKHTSGQRTSTRKLPITTRKRCPHTFNEVAGYRYQNDQQPTSRDIPGFILSTGTLTATPDNDSQVRTLSRHLVRAYHTWYTATRKYVMGLRGSHTSLRYIRSLELQKRGTPHFHALLATIPSLRCDICDNGSLCQDAYNRLQSLWTGGYSKHEALDTVKPKQLGYVLKYATKTASAKTVWRKVYDLRDAFDEWCDSHGHGHVLVDDITDSRRASTLDSPAIDVQTPEPESVWLDDTLERDRVKILTWTADFPFQWFFQRVVTDDAFQYLWNKFTAEQTQLTSCNG